MMELPLFGLSGWPGEGIPDRLCLARRGLAATEWGNEIG